MWSSVDGFTRTKFASESVVEHYKDHLVSNEFYQQEGIDYTKTFSPIAKMN